MGAVVYSIEHAQWNGLIPTTLTALVIGSSFEVKVGNFVMVLWMAVVCKGFILLQRHVASTLALSTNSIQHWRLSFLTLYDT